MASRIVNVLFLHFWIYVNLAVAQTSSNTKSVAVSEIQAFNATTFSDPADVVVNLPPLAPINLVGTPGTNSIALRWSVPVGAVTYNVYRGSTSGGEGATPFAANQISSTRVDPPPPPLGKTNIEAGFGAVCQVDVSLLLPTLNVKSLPLTVPSRFATSIMIPLIPSE